ncbi:FAD/FMN-containing dehydrogenase [Inhella inkyongensis]|uniref:FAD/FMN-containing dehydrogenase n=1 Tax=Inhella inkyongensis TaxID=392593 RepID=A0A840S117_9BURK|nr:FAD-binding protein [Inhella inkyongensis]MBB5203965.1 FAD/FMN-containing dehydrogenase [Inhella inkyongensis]
MDDAATARQRYGQDTGAQQRELSGALRLPAIEARNAAERASHVDRLVAQVLEIARQYRQALHPISTGRNWGYGTALPARSGCVLLDLGTLCQLEVDPELGVASVEPGVTQEQLAQHLKDKGLPFLVPVTGAGPRCSLLSNALERGYGVTPVTDHYAAVTNLEAVMADGSRFRSALREAAGPELARLFKWGLGPHGQGLFTQSGMGVVTRLSIALARRPDAIQACLFSIPDDARLERTVEAMRALLQRLPGLIGAINLMNRHRVLSMSAPYPWTELDPQGLIPPEVLLRLGRQYQVQAWTGFCTLYGTRATVAAARAELRRALGPLASRLLFVTPDRAAFLARATARLPSWANGLKRLTQTLRSSLELVAGQPNETALPLAYWRNRRAAPQDVPREPHAHGCGLLWYAPLVPMRGQDARRYADMVHEVARAHGVEPLITFTTLGERVFDSTVPILFDRDNPEATARAQACAAQLLRRGQALGFFPYRLGIQAMADLRELAPEACAWHRRLRSTWDPEDLLAPDRYC